MFQRLRVVFLAAALLLAACTGADSEGTLIAVIDPQGETSGFGDFTNGTDKSFGIFVCSRDGGVELESITAVDSDGDVELLGAQVYTSPDMFVGAANGFPPDGIESDRLEPLEGAVVDITCDEPEGDDLVQIIVGAERTSAEGGVINGLEVDTSGGTLTIDYTILMCGDDLEFCEFLVDDA